MVHRLLTPRWLAGLMLAIVGSLGMLALGRWQLHRGEATRSLQNYAYAIEWTLFAAFTLFCFYRFIRDAVREEAGDLTDARPPSYANVVAPVQRVVAQDDPDPELEAYNAYLAQLAHGNVPRDLEQGR